MERDTYHIGLWNYARSFYYSGNDLREINNTDISAPVYYLYCHAIELVLKSLIIFQGNNEKDLRNIGHDLIKAWKVSSADTVISLQSEIGEIVQTIEMINPYYSSKEFEYIVTGGKTYPELTHMHNVAQNLIISIGKEINIPSTQLNRTLNRTAQSAAR